MKTICIFEDEGYKDLLPLVYARPVFELRCGMTSLRDKLERLYARTKSVLLCRDYLIPTLKESVAARDVNDIAALGDEGCLFLNGRILVLAPEADKIPLEGNDEVIMSGETLIAIRLTNKTLKEKVKYIIPSFTEETKRILIQDLKVTEREIKIIKYPWDLIRNNAVAISSDYEFGKGKGEKKGYVNERVEVLGDEHQLYVGIGSRIEGPILLDVREGPIYIGNNVVVNPPTVIEGPTFIGDGTIIEGAKIRKGTSIGEICRIAGEVEESIFHGYDNKHHEGFVSHSYVCEWVDLGAMTTTVVLEDTYDDVKAHMEDGLVDSGEIKMGSFIGDHTKIETGVSLSPGTVVGVSCDIDISQRLLRGFVPSFMRHAARSIIDYEMQEGDITFDIKTAIEKAQRMMGRREVKQTEADAELLKKIHEITADQRAKVEAIKPWSIS